MNSTDSPPDAEISVIIVNYGTAALAIDAVESVLAREHGGRTVDIHLLDNASPGADAADLARAHAARNWGARVTLYLEAENHGFGRGNNVVLRALASRKAPPRKVMLLNPDARLKLETISVLADVLDANAEIGIAGCGINRPDGRAVTAVFRFPSVLGEFLAGAALGPLNKLFSNHLVARSPDVPTGPVDWVSGAAFMGRFSALCDIGFFDPDYFLYFEETDLMLRLTRKGWRIWHVAGVNIDHVAGAATGMKDGRHQSREQPKYWYDSWRLYFLKTGGIRHARTAALVRYLGAVLNHLICAFRRRPPSGPTNFLKDFYRHVVEPLFRRKKRV